MTGTKLHKHYRVTLTPILAKVVTTTFARISSALKCSITLQLVPTVNATSEPISAIHISNKYSDGP